MQLILRLNDASTNEAPRCKQRSISVEIAPKQNPPSHLHASARLASPFIPAVNAGYSGEGE